MRNRSGVYFSAALSALLLLVGRASAQSVTYTFSDGTSDGWDQGGFSDSTPDTIDTISGTNYIHVPIGGFQVTNVATGNPADPLYTAMLAAAADPSLYDLSYQWYVNTADFTGATINSYLQLGTFVNGSDGAYDQDFGGIKEVQLSGAQLTSGQVFSGTVTINMAAAGLTLPPTETYWRLGFIENGDSGVPYVVDFTNISLSPVPEPATFGLGVLMLAGLALRRRRRV